MAVRNGQLAIAGRFSRRISTLGRSERSVLPTRAPTSWHVPHNRPCGHTPTQGAVKTHYIMPAEWAPQSGTLTVWPDFESLEDEELLRACQSEVLNISNTIARFQPVTMFTKHGNAEIAKAGASENVTIISLSASHLWVRDTGPVFVKNTADESPAGVVLNFNCWGAKLPRQGDQDVAQSILSKMGVLKVTAPFRAEGGAIEVDGEGTLLATESSILNLNRNPEMSRMQLEEGLSRVLGIEKVLWLPGVKGHDITDYHIDGFARFVSPGVVLLGKPVETAARVLVKAYREAKKILDQATDAKGRRLRVVEIVEPDVGLIPGRRSWTMHASYVNHLVVNGGVIIPRFGVRAADERAFELFCQLFPSREVVQVDINALPRVGGGIHCATLQVPAL